MEATIRKDDERKVTLILDGRLDTAVTPQTEKEVEPLYAYEGYEIVIDCSRLEYISSSGLRIFLSIALDTQSSGKHVVITGINDFVHNLFEMTGFTELFDYQ